MFDKIYISNKNKNLNVFAARVTLSHDSTILIDQASLLPSLVWVVKCSFYYIYKKLILLMLAISRITASLLNLKLQKKPRVIL
jgi:hypothetical protein